MDKSSPCSSQVVIIIIINIIIIITIIITIIIIVTIIIVIIITIESKSMDDLSPFVGQWSSKDVCLYEVSLWRAGSS